MKPNVLRFNSLDMKVEICLVCIFSPKSRLCPPWRRTGTCCFPDDVVALKSWNSLPITWEPELTTTQGPEVWFHSPFHMQGKAVYLSQWQRHSFRFSEAVAVSTHLILKTKCSRFHEFHEISHTTAKTPPVPREEFLSSAVHSYLFLKLLFLLPTEMAQT